MLALARAHSICECVYIIQTKTCYFSIHVQRALPQKTHRARRGNARTGLLWCAPRGVREFLYVIKRNVNRCPLWWWTLIFSPLYPRTIKNKMLCVSRWALSLALQQPTAMPPMENFELLSWCVCVCRWIILNRPLLLAPASPVPARSRIRPHGAPPLHKFISAKLRGSFNKEPQRRSLYGSSIFHHLPLYA